VCVCVLIIVNSISHASCDPAGAEQENFIGCNAVEGMELLEGKLKKGLPSQPGLTCVKYEEENRVFLPIRRPNLTWTVCT
jgi:hypothetical protein